MSRESSSCKHCRFHRFRLCFLIVQARTQDTRFVSPYLLLRTVAGGVHRLFGGCAPAFQIQGKSLHTSYYPSTRVLGTERTWMLQRYIIVSLTSRSMLFIS